MKNLSKIFMMVISAALISCGGEKKEEEEKITIGSQNTESTSPVMTETTSDSTTTLGENVVEVKLTANDQMQFSKNEIRVKEGQTVRLTLEHIGEMAENVMGHNFVLLKQGTDISQFGQAAAGAAENGYIPVGTDKVIAHTEMLGGGESDTIEFQAPPAGTYEFICSFPGHYAVMKGTFIVE